MEEVFTMISIFNKKSTKKSLTDTRIAVYIYVEIQEKHKCILIDRHSQTDVEDTSTKIILNASTFLQSTCWIICRKSVAQTGIFLIYLHRYYLLNSMKIQEPIFLAYTEKCGDIIRNEHELYLLTTRKSEVR